MSDVVVFAGTTEGYEICSFLAKNKVSVLACVATDYGSKSLKEDEYLKIHAGRLNGTEMEKLLKKLSPGLVLDATHPYAAEVTENIRAACQNTGFSYQRVLREAGAYQDKAVYVENTEAAVEFLEGTKGNILLTTGSKELGKFTALSDAGERIYARVLSLPSVMETCKGYGFEGKHLIGMQGPFSMELNAAMLRQYDCKYLVTKDTGKAGGFQEKIDAALMCDVIPVIIGRPLQEEEGLSVAKCKHMLAEHFGLTLKPHVTLLGIGMGSEKTLTIQGKRAVQRADLIIGARRMADSIREPGQQVVYEYRSDVIDIPGVDMSTGSLGQGVSAAVGMAISAKLFGDDYRVYTLLGDGEIQEGQVWEAAMLAAHRKLDNLVVIVDNNGLQIDGKIDDVNSPYPIDKKFEAFRFHVINVDGHDFDALKQAFDEARTVKGQPTAIIAKTIKGKGVSFMEDQASWHGVAPNDEQYKLAMEELEKAGEALCQK